MKPIYLLLFCLLPFFSYSQYEIILTSGDTVEIKNYKTDNGFYSLTKEDGTTSRISMEMVKSIRPTYLGTPTEQKFVYCQLVGTQKFLSMQETVSIDYGQERGFFQDNRMRDETGKVQTFNSMVDALNYMGTMGWEFEQAYVVTMGQSNVYHWLLKRNK